MAHDGRIPLLFAPQPADEKEDMMYYHDPEIPAGYQDADLEQAEFERQSREFDARMRKMRILRANGELRAAAQACTHSWGYPLDSEAAVHANDPRTGEEGWRCNHCGSALVEDPFLYGADYAGNCPIIAPCELPPKEDI